MRRTLFAALAAGGALPATAGPALAAGPAPDANDDAGVIVSSAAGPGFGRGVSAAAQRRIVGNFGLAGCGDHPRRNPS